MRRKLSIGSLSLAAVLSAFLSPWALVPAQTAYQGYTLYSPTNSKYTYLIDMNGTRVHTWQHTTTGGYSAYLLPNGHLIRAGNAPGSHLTGAASHGLIEEVDWNGNVIWQYTCAGSTYVAHHDIEPMPNGNVLLIVWEVKTAAQTAAAGRTPGVTMWPDYILEIRPTGSTATPVWEWHAWDHLVQDKDPSKPNYGVVASHPELFNINMGSVGMGGDWMHLNGISYNPDLDQIVVSSHLLNEIYVIDHSTTTAQAAGHTGGRYGRGGDILYRWGKPSNYGAPGSAYFNVVHCAWWVPKGLPGEGNILAFNNRQGTGSSIVAEIVPPHDTNGGYTWTPGTAYGPAAPVWTYSNGTNFYSQHLGGNQRLPNGNALITESTRNRIIEVTPGGSVVWQFNAGVEVARSLRYAPDYPGLATLGGSAKIAGPASVSFDTVAVKSSAERDIVLKNTGTAQLSITSTVAAPAVFSIVSGGGARTINAGDSATVRMRFSPVTAGAASGTLTVSSNASNAATFVVSLSGVAVDAPLLTPVTSSLDFGSVLIGSSSSRTLQITNTGTGTLTITSASVAGTHAADFTILSPSTLSIPAGKKDSIILSFTPQGSGKREAELHLQSNDRTNPVTTVWMTGLGERPLPVMALSPDMLEFDTLFVGEERLRSVLIRNTGNGPLEVTGTSVTGPDAGCFTVAQACAGTIDPQQADSLTIRFAPGTPGEKEAFFSVSGNDPLHPSRMVTLRGTALQRLPVLAFEPQELMFDTVEIGSNTTGRILLENHGNGTLNIRNPGIGGADASSFALVHTGPSALLPGARDSMTIRFAPPSTGRKSATLSFTTDDPQQPFVSIPLGGIGVSHVPIIRLSASSLDFGARELGSPCERRVVVSNIGTADLRLFSQEIRGADTGDFAIIRYAQNVIPPAGADSITLLFSPTAVGSRTAILRIDSNDPLMQSVEIMLSGAGITLPTPRIVVSPQTMDFGVVQPGNETTRFIEISNSGTADLTITSQCIGGKDS
ncbi:MAG: choice-of-anchor D domain-containing protein, partial [Bacteroidota bacterium]|nr:choice-of-anchor D domain-containing protein [Bacteroidota bacterium]